MKDNKGDKKLSVSDVRKCLKIAAKLWKGGSKK